MTSEHFEQVAFAYCGGSGNPDELMPPGVAAAAMLSVTRHLQQGKPLEELCVKGTFYDKALCEPFDNEPFEYTGVRVYTRFGGMLHARPQLNFWVTLGAWHDLDGLFVAVELEDGTWGHTWDGDEGGPFDEHGMPELACAGLSLLMVAAAAVEDAAYTHHVNLG